MFFYLNWNREYEMECTQRQVTMVHDNKRIKDVKGSLKWEPFWWQISSSVHLIAVHHNIIVSQCFCVWRLWSEGESTKFLSKHSSCHSHSAKSSHINGLLVEEVQRDWTEQGRNAVSVLKVHLQLVLLPSRELCLQHLDFTWLSLLQDKQHAVSYTHLTLPTKVNV